jgi:hypothetical protein
LDVFNTTATIYNRSINKSLIEQKENLGKWKAPKVPLDAFSFGIDEYIRQQAGIAECLMNLN